VDSHQQAPEYCVRTALDLLPHHVPVHRALRNWISEGVGDPHSIVRETCMLHDPVSTARSYEESGNKEGTPGAPRSMSCASENSELTRL
jgi:hypothetical protein